MRPRTALIVDDYAPARYAHARVLKEGGFVVYEASDGHTGLALAHRHLPHVILLDVNLPDVHGFELCEQLKASRATRQIPVVHLTATSRGDRYRREAIAAGADLFLEEPLDPADLLRAVNRVIQSASRGGVAGEVLLLTPFEDECGMYCAFLKQERYHVRCGSPESGYDLARTVRPDVVVTRILPGDVGLALARSLKNDPATAGIPVVVITTYPDERHRFEAEAIGVAEYFVLPLEPELLVQAVRRQIARAPR